MKKWLVACLLVCQLGLYADSWMPAAAPIPEGASDAVSLNVKTVYDPATEMTVAAWADQSSNHIPFYALYDGTSWSTQGTPIPLGTSIGVDADVNLVYNVSNNTVVATWADASTLFPFYAVFDGSNWIVPGTPISPGTSTGVYNNVNVTYNPSNNTIVAAWTDTTTRLGFYSVFDGTTWTTGSIPLGVSRAISDDVIVTYNAANNTVIAAWADYPTLLPYYAVFNGLTWTVSGTAIPVGTSSGVNDNVTLAYYPTFKTVIAAWGDSVTYLPFFAVFNGTSWTAASAIPPGTSTPGAYGNINMAFDSDSDTIIAAWSEQNIFLPYSSVYDGTFWSTRAIPYLPSNGVDYDVELSYNVSAHQMVATWGQYPGDNDPFYQIYTITVAPVTDLIGGGFWNKFASQKNWVNRLEWQLSTSTFVTGYNIYRNGLLVGHVDSDTFWFNDQGISRKKQYTYGVTAVTGEGQESSVVTLTLP